MTSSAHSPTVLQCSTPAQFLASVPILLGYLPTSSIVVTLFEHSRAQCAARFDLPAAHVPLESTNIDRSVVELVARFSWATSIAIVIYTGETFASSPGTPHAMLAMWLERAIEIEGIAVRELACVADDGWAVYRSPTSDRPRPLSEIAELQDSWIAELPEHGPIPTLDSLGTLPDPDEVLCESIRASLLTQAPIDFATITLREFSQLVTQCSQAITSNTAEPNVEAITSLIRLTEHMQTWLIPVMLISADTEGEFAALSDETAHAFLALLQNPALTPPAGGTPVAQRLLMFSSEKLAQGRLRLVINTLVTLTAHTSPAHRPGMLALTAWAWWMGGMTTPASLLLDDARDLEPAHPAVLTVGELFDNGTPLWVFAHHDR